MDFEDSLKPELFEFLKVAEKQRFSKCCDLKNYDLWKTVIPIDETLRNKTEISPENNETTALIDDQIDDDVEIVTNSVDVDGPQINTKDLVFAIKENLESQQTLSDDLHRNLQTCLEIEVVFIELHQILNGIDVYSFGNYLMNHSSDQKITQLYCRHILIPQLFKEHFDNLQELLPELFRRNGDLKQELLQQIKKHHTRAFLSYIHPLNSQHKTEILRGLVFDIENVARNHLELIDSLLNNTAEFEILRKIVELLSNQCGEFNSEKIIGKLLMKIIEFCQQNILQLQQPLKHLIDTHQSVWKARLRKKFDCCFEDSMILSQSFRY